MSLTFKYLTRKEIDDRQWDNCINGSKKPLCSALSWYLDIVSPNWHALVLENYHAVLPLQIKSKAGFKYTTHPIFCQQHGIFSTTNLTQSTIEQFYEHIARFLFIEIQSQPYFLPKLNKKIIVQTRPNYELALNNSFFTIHQKMSRNTKWNLRQAEKHQLTVIQTTPPEEFYKFYLTHHKERYTTDQFDKLNQIIHQSIEQNTGRIYSCLNDENEIISLSLFFFLNNRIVYFKSVSSEEGYLKRANFKILSTLIEEYCTSNYILDFEGSRNEGIARFLEGWGAQLQPYFAIRKKSHIDKIVNFKNKHQIKWI